MIELLKVFALTAGIGGLALGVFFILFKRIDLPRGTRRHLTLFMWLVWSVCVIGMFIYLANQLMDRSSPQERLDSSKSQGTDKAENAPIFNIELVCGVAPPREDSELARLFKYAEDNEGEIARVSVKYQPCLHKKADSSDPYLLEEIDTAKINPNWWLAEKMKNYNCVEALGLAGNIAGIGSFCFPLFDALPLREGYSREIRATSHTISGDFLLVWEWGGGAAHVQLLIPE